MMGDYSPVQLGCLRIKEEGPVGENLLGARDDGGAGDGH